MPITAIPGPSHIVICNFNAAVNFLALVDLNWFEAKIFDFDRLPFVFWVFIGIRCFNSVIFRCFAINIPFDNICNIFTLWISQNPKSMKHNRSLGDECDCVPIRCAQVIILVRFVNCKICKSLPHCMFTAS